MKYAVMTAKHHEGFACLTLSTPTIDAPIHRQAGTSSGSMWRRFGQRGSGWAFYYSLIDWHHPDFTVDMLHPRRDDPEAQSLNQGRNMKRYAQYMRDQVTELLTNYGKIDILWFDFSYSENHDGAPWMRGRERRTGRQRS